MTLVVLKRDQNYVSANGAKRFAGKGQKADIPESFLAYIKGKYEVFVDAEAEEKAKKEAEELAALEAEEKAKKEAEELAALEAEEKAKKSKKS